MVRRGRPWPRAGFGDAANQQTGGLTVFNGYLYVGTRNDTIGGQIWRSANGTDWAPVGAPGLGDSNNVTPDGLIVFQGQLYVFEGNLVTGIEAWRSPDGTHWTQINPDGFGDSSNVVHAVVERPGCLQRASVCGDG